jgi:hypothetical protein
MIGSIDYFDYYFQLNIPNNQISNNEFLNIIKLKNSPQDFIKQLNFYIKNKKFYSLLLELNNCAILEFSEIEDKDILFDLIRELSEFSELLEINQDINFPTPFNLIVALISKLIDRYAYLDLDELNAEIPVEQLIVKINLLETLVDQTNEFRYIHLKLLINFGKIIDFYEIKIDGEGNEIIERKQEKILHGNYYESYSISKIIQMELKITQKIVILSKSDSLANHNFYDDILDFWSIVDKENVNKYNKQYYPED